MKGALAIALLLAAMAATVAGSLVNVRILRTIDTSRVVVQQSVKYVVRNDGTSPATFVDISLTHAEASALLRPPVVAEGHETRKPVAPLDTKELDSSDSTSSLYRVRLAQDLKPGSTAKLVAYLTFGDSLHPSPAQVRENDEQYIQFSTNAYVSSPYLTEKMETVLTLPSAKVTSALDGPQPISQSGESIRLGPYENVESFSDVPISVRFRNRNAFVAANMAVKELYVSHWGNVVVKEEYQIQNVGAKYVGRWSRVDYTRATASAVSSIEDVWAYLPKEATNVVYKDLVGNITSSHLRAPNEKYRPLQLKFRYPLLGGWRNHFWFTYDVPLSALAVSSGHTHVLAVPVFPSVTEQLLCRDYLIRVLLPEGASTVVVEPHPTLDFSVEEGLERTSLNYFGRKVIYLRARDLYNSKIVHASHVNIKYEFSNANLLASPAIVIAGIFAMFLTLIAYVGTEFNLLPPGDDPYAQYAAQVGEQQLCIASACRAMSLPYDDLAVLFSALESSADISDFASRKMQIEARLKEREDEVSAAAETMKLLGSRKHQLAFALVERFARKRDACMRALTSRKMLVDGRMTKDEFDEQMNDRIAPALESTVDEIDELSAALAEF